MSKLVLINSEEVHLYIDEGVPWSMSLTVTDAANVPINLTGKDITMEIRDTIGGTILLAKSDALNGDITNGGVLGTITIVFPYDDLIGATWERAVYDVKVEALARVMRGDVIISKQVTV